MNHPELVIVGRSSSHFTRVARMFALELRVPHTFRPVFDILSLDPENYASNPALKVPILIDEEGPLFGCENICRALKRRAGDPSNVIVRGDVSDRVVANAEELTLHVMSSEVFLITAKMTNNAVPAPPKVAPSIENSLRFLDDHVDAVLEALPRDRVVSFVEVALFCVVTHLPFREVTDVSSWSRLGRFCSDFAERESARSTEYHFDAR